MTQTTQELIQQAENRLWAECVAARARLHESYELEDKFWHEYVQTGLQDAVARQNWRTYVVLSDDLLQRKNDAVRAWERVAYPLYDIHVNVETEDE